METSNGFSADPDDKRQKCARLCEDCNTQNRVVKHKLQRLEYMLLGEACKYYIIILHAEREPLQYNELIE